MALVIPPKKFRTSRELRAKTQLRATSKILGFRWPSSICIYIYIYIQTEPGQRGTVVAKNANYELEGQVNRFIDRPRYFLVNPQLLPNIVGRAASWHSYFLINPQPLSYIVGRAGRTAVCDGWSVDVMLWSGHNQSQLPVNNVSECLFDT